MATGKELYRVADIRCPRRVLGRDWKWLNILRSSSNSARKLRFLNSFRNLALRCEFLVARRAKRLNSDENAIYNDSFATMACLK
jgi:hypothetical protein